MTLNDHNNNERTKMYIDRRKKTRKPSKILTHR